MQAHDNSGSDAACIYTIISHECVCVCVCGGGGGGGWWRAGSEIFASLQSEQVAKSIHDIYYLIQQHGMQNHALFSNTKP